LAYKKVFIPNGTDQNLEYECPKRIPDDLGTKYFAGGNACASTNGFCRSEQEILDSIRLQYNNCAVDVYMTGALHQPYEAAWGAQLSGYEGTLLGNAGCRPLALRRNITVTHYDNIAATNSCGTTLYTSNRGNVYTYQGVNQSTELKPSKHLFSINLK